MATGCCKDFFRPGHSEYVAIPTESKLLIMQNMTPPFGCAEEADEDVFAYVALRTILVLFDRVIVVVAAFDGRDKNKKRVLRSHDKESRNRKPASNTPGIALSKIDLEST